MNRRPVRLTRVAERDLEQAAGWYRREAPAVSPRFRRAVRELQRNIGERPMAYPVVRRGLRRAVMARFPYSLFFQVHDEGVLVVAVVHHARHPRHWPNNP